MHYELVTATDYDNLPEGLGRKFVAIEELCRRNMNTVLSGSDDIEFKNKIKRQYMDMMKAAAKELDISGLSDPFSIFAPFDARFERFMRNMTTAITKTRLRILAEAEDEFEENVEEEIGSQINEGDDGDTVDEVTPISVHISTKTRTLIEGEIDKLREIICYSDFSASKKDELLKKLDELQSEINNGRVGFGKTLAVMAFVLAAAPSAAGFFADAPNAVATITKLLGIDKMAEDAEQKRMEAPAPQRALPAPSQPVLKDMPEGQ